LRQSSERPREWSSYSPVVRTHVPAKRATVSVAARG
jgi:hypothetical protein